MPSASPLDVRQPRYDACKPPTLTRFEKMGVVSSSEGSRVGAKTAVKVCR